MGLYEMHYVFLVGMETMLTNFHICRIMLLLRTNLNMLVRNGSPTGSMCFTFLFFILSGPCELLF